MRSTPHEPFKFFMGICATWDMVDRGAVQDLIEQFKPGAFARTVMAFNIGQLQLPVLFDHGVDDQFGSDPIGRVLLLAESKRGLETTFTIDVSHGQRVLERLGGGTWYLSVGYLFHAFMVDYTIQSSDGVKPDEGARPHLLIKDCLMTELSIVSTPAAGPSSKAHALDHAGLGFPQPLQVTP